MILYYSTHKQTFNKSPKYNENTHNRAKKFSLFEYKKMDKHTISYRDEWIINTKKYTCSCRFFLKYAICSHILGLMYKYPKIGAQCWFGEKYSNRATDFNFNMKRGAKKKTPGCAGRYSNAEKALSKD